METGVAVFLFNVGSHIFPTRSRWRLTPLSRLITTLTTSRFDADIAACCSVALSSMHTELTFYYLSRGMMSTRVTCGPLAEATELNDLRKLKVYKLPIEYLAILQT